MPSSRPRSGTRLCTKCGVNRQLKSFKPNGRVCLLCQKKGRKKTARSAHVKNTYGLTPEDHAELLAFQGGGCAICGGTRAVLDVDHDHSKDHLGAYAVRGLLCAQHNRRLLTAAKNDPAILRAAADYLESPPTHRLWGW